MSCCHDTDTDMRNDVCSRESDNDTCNKILASVRAEMKKTPFSFPNPLRGARILDGWEEGVFSWITVNYLTGNLGQVSRSGHIQI